MSDSMRSLKAFGVASLLGADAEIIFTNEFKAKSLGRISDLVSAKINSAEMGDYRLREILNGALFFAAKIKGAAPGNISLEVGQDKNYVAIGTSVCWHDSFKWDVGYFKQSVTERKDTHGWEGFIYDLHAQSTQLIVRFQARERRLEVVCLVHRREGALRDPFEVVELNDAKNPLFEVKSYQELGDLPYSDLLSDGTEKRVVSAEVVPAPVDVVVKEVAPPPPDSWGKKILKSIWPFADEEKKVVAREARTVLTETTLVSATDTPATVDDAPMTIAAFQTTEEIPEDTKLLIEQLEELSKSDPESSLQHIVSEIKQEVVAEKSSRWVNGIVNEIVSEKSRLKELAQEMDKKLRQRELEFKNQQSFFQNQNIKLETQLKQKDTLYLQKVEQIQNLQQLVEQGKKDNKSGEDQQLKFKIIQTQRLLNVREQEAMRLGNKLREVETKLFMVQSKLNRPNLETQLKSRIESAEKKIDEYKRVNQKLLQSLNEKGSSPRAGASEETERQLNEARKSVEKYAFKLKELQEQEKKIQTDLYKALEENKRLRDLLAQSQAA